VHDRSRLGAAQQGDIARLPSDDRNGRLEGLLGFILAGLALAGSPGPATLSLAATGAAFGARRGLGYMTGINLGMVAVMAITASGIVGLLLAVPGATPVVIGVSSAYFAYLAYRIATAPPLAEAGAQRRQPSFLAGIGLSLVNPKGYAAMAALFSSFVLIERRLELDVAAKIAVLAIIIAAVNVAWLLMGAALTGYFREPRSNRIINVTFAVLLIASVGVALLF
jgi:threonine/homoserine/homoserine lactone efflux protein